jgi:hypothetical protein
MGKFGITYDSSTYEDEFVIFPVEVVEVISPKILNISCINETVAIWSGLDKHHRW